MALGQGEIGQRIKQAREEAGLTQVELTALIGLKHSQSVSNYERGIGEVPPHRMRRISEATSKPLSYFFAAENGEAQDGVQAGQTELGLLRKDIAQLSQVVATIAAAQKKIATDLDDDRPESDASQPQASEQP